MATVRERLTELSLCEVCALSLPRTADSGVCSRGCAGLRKHSAAVNGSEQPEWRQKILASMAELKPGATICPGELSQAVLPGIDKPLTVLRTLMYQMAENGKVVLSQKGRYFLSWAQVWRANTRPEELQRRLKIDPHSPVQFRCNGPLSNLAEFQAAFGIPDGAPMVRPAEEKAQVW